MLFRLLLLLALAGALTVFTVQNLTPIPLVFVGMALPALPLSWWVLGAIAAGALSMVAIQILFGLSTWVTATPVRSPFRRAGQAQASSFTATTSSSRGDRRTNRRDRSAEDDSMWQDWRGYEPSPSPSTRRPPPLDEWERPPRDEWEPGEANREVNRDVKREVNREPVRRSASDGIPPGGANSDRDRRPPSSSASSSADTVVDADYRVIVPPYNPLNQPYTPPPPPPPEENADDWFEEASDDFESPSTSSKPSQ